MKKKTKVKNNPVFRIRKNREHTKRYTIALAWLQQHYESAAVAMLAVMYDKSTADVIADLRKFEANSRNEMEKRIKRAHKLAKKRGYL